MKTALLRGVRWLGRALHTLVHPDYEEERRQLARLEKAASVGAEQVARMAAQLQPVAERLLEERAEVARLSKAVNDASEETGALRRLISGEQRERLSQIHEFLRSHHRTLAPFVKQAGKELAVLRGSLDRVQADLQQISFRSHMTAALLGDAEEVRDKLEGRVRRGLARVEAEGWAGQFRYLEQIESAVEQEAEAAGKALVALRSLLGDLKSQLAPRYLAEHRPEWAGRQLKVAVRGVPDDYVRAALKSQVADEREKLVAESVRSGAISWNRPLVRELRYGEGMDERVVELPLALEVARLSSPGKVLDAGAALNLPLVHTLVGRPAAQVCHFTQSADEEPPLFAGDRFCYLFGDLRHLDFKDGAFDRVICVSTLEHVGMDNSRYGGTAEHAPGSCVDAARELLRVLAADGDLLLSVPYGAPQDFGWFHVFGQSDLRPIFEAAADRCCSARYFYYDGCWYEGTSEVPRPARADVEGTDAVTGLAVVRIGPRAN